MEIIQKVNSGPRSIFSQGAVVPSKHDGPKVKVGKGQVHVHKDGVR